MFFPDPGSAFFFIPDPEVKKGPDLGSLISNTLYQIRRPLGLAFVIYFWLLGELLLLYI
jgi:hypothetical protein